VRIIIAPDGPIASLRSNLIQSQLFSLVWTNDLKESTINGPECMDWDLPYQCIFKNGTIGSHKCVNGYYSDCTLGIIEPFDIPFVKRERRQLMLHYPKRLHNSRALYRYLPFITGYTFLTLVLIFVCIHLQAHRRSRDIH